jgi:hypothetical protein
MYQDDIGALTGGDCMKASVIAELYGLFVAHFGSTASGQQCCGAAEVSHKCNSVKRFGSGTTGRPCEQREPVPLT